MTIRDRLPTTRLTGAGPAPSIGVLIDCLDDSGYQSAILHGAIETARDCGAHLLCFAGGVIEGASGEGRERNRVFDFARSKNVDALVVLSGSVGKRIGAARLDRFCDAFGPLPVCSVAVDLARTSSICIENESGMRIVIEHLIRTHAIRDIAFIRGPEANEEAERRYRVYRDVLAAEGIAFRPELVALGTFEPSSGAQAVDVLFGERRLSGDAVRAIVAANDSMALGAMEALARRGVRVPDAMAVVGFDDVDEARFALPPLTTVRQPLFEQGRDAVRIVLDHIRTGVRAERVVRSTELVARRSCGCLARSTERARGASDPPPGMRVTFEVGMLRNRQVILAEMARAARGGLSGAGTAWGERLLSAFVEQVRGDSQDAFFHAFDDFLRRIETSGATPALCNDVLSAMRAAALRGVGDDAARRERAEDLFHEATMMTARVSDRAQAQHRTRAVRSARALGRALAAIASCRSRPDLLAAAHEHLPALGIGRWYVLERSPTDERTARVALADSPGIHSAKAGSFVPVADVLRHHVLSAREDDAFAVMPMTSGSNEIGILALEIGGEDYAYETLRDVFTAAWAQIPSPGVLNRTGR